MYINFWYAMEQSKNVSSEAPTKLRRLNQDFVLFRDREGKAHCLHDVCTHRGGSLSAGVISPEDGCVQCPYHGWRFDGAGDCVYIPSQGKKAQKIPPRTRVDSYPVQEHDGVIFAFLGDLPEDERPPLMRPKHSPQEYKYEEASWRTTALSWRINSNYERCVENGLDPSHNEFVHTSHGFEGKRLDEYFVPGYDVEHHDWGQGFWIDFNAPKAGDGKVISQSEREEEGNLKVSTGHNGPNAVWTYIHITDTNWAHQYLYETPVSSTETAAINVSLVNFVDADTPDEDIDAMNQYIAEQDVVILNNIMPVTTPETMREEVMVSADKCVLEYRRYLRRWDAKGWRIDHEKVEAELGKKVYAIPSPRRRTEKGWVFDAVPLIAAKNES